MPANNDENANPYITDPVALARILMDVAEQTQPLLQDFLEHYEYDPSDNPLSSPVLFDSWFKFMNHLMNNPKQMAEVQTKFWTDWMNLWQQSALRFMGAEGVDLYPADDNDRRFKNPAWQESAVFDFIKQSYLLTRKWTEETIQNTEGLDDTTRRQLQFYSRQFSDALAPSNFLLTNPEVLQETMDSGGQNLVRGFKNLVNDLKRGHGELRISTTKFDEFEVGRNIATTPGKVVYQNDLMQLIQYAPTTKKVHKTPFLIIPPWINKFYILDLRPENSLIKWLVEQGHTVFAVSWVNPNKELAEKRFEDYMEEGVFDAMDQIKSITGENNCNILGYCLGGTLVASTLAWLEAKGHDDRIASATLLTTLIDFERAGDLKLFVDDAQLKLIDQQMEEHGFLTADYMRKTFSLLRSNDMIWSFVVNNYLLGKEPFPFDLLYWNDDATNMPAAMHRFYLRQCYRDNLLTQPDRVIMNGVPIDMRKVDTPTYFLSTREDHIAPWRATYDGASLMKDNVTFTLSASGHVAGVINPPEKKKYCYWINSKLPTEPEEWLENATQHDGSWWPHWGKWLKKQAGTQIPARQISKSIEDAPGSYVKMKAD
jgi:polyhydroxyalkanoate synthase